MTRWLRHLTAGVRALVARRRDERALSDEYRAFLAEAAAARMAAGAPADEARTAAARECGSLARARDGVRDVSWESRVEDLLMDLRVAGRASKRAPGFTLAAVATLALGIGANAAVFSLVNGLVLRTVPGVELSRVVALARKSPEMSEGDVRGLFATPAERHAIEAAALPDIAGVFTSVSVLGALSTEGIVEPVATEAVSAPYFEALGVMPVAGRFFYESDDVDSTADTPAVISEPLFRTWFGGDAARAIGARAVMAGQPLTIVGVAPSTFMGTWLPTIRRTDVWLPAAAAHRFSTIQGVRSPDQPRRTFLWLTPEASRERVRAAVDTIGRSSAEAHRGTLTVIAPERAMLFDAFMGPGRIAGAFFVGLSLLVFLTACANLTNLVLVRAASRTGEIAVRLAIGAGRWRVARLLAIEVVVVTALAGVAALGVTVGFTALMARVPLPRLDLVRPTFDPTPDLTVFAYAMATAAIATFIVGIAPAWRVAGTAPMTSMKPGGFGGTTRRGARARAATVGVQVALSTVLLAVAGLFGRSAIAMTHFDPGYDASRATMAAVNLELHGYDEVRGRQAQERILDAARALPGVEFAMLTSGLPPAAPLQWVTRLRLERDVSAAGRNARQLLASPGLFTALGIRLVAGREFQPWDQSGTSAVALINRTLAGLLGIENDALGHRLVVGDRPPAQIVGIIENIRVDPRQPDDDAPLLVLPTTQHYAPRMTVVVTSAVPAQMVEPLRRAVRSAEPDLAVTDARLLTEASHMFVSAYRIGGLIVATLGGLGVSIALFGLYGVLSFVITERTREFGIRRALGATSGSIYRMVVVSGLWMTGIGTVVGLALALATAELLTSFLHRDVPPHDIVTLVCVAVFLALTTTAGSALAARRAARVDPNVALRDL